jgi:hypothetical protein
MFVSIPPQQAHGSLNWAFTISGPADMFKVWENTGDA